ncbi:MAG: M23 family metallopeptidase [Candidatus Moranbacteria bacterium]|nr:M23 family metallopeptidase [Candidatus Moranbacteria bacterium]MDD5652182.1 M23 family metallopeptidase [Candidatus Moranbacteria bacterium]MDX9855721.1 M23 family metallopeptidase [Candidatus Moranbacteria bacterium]
MLFSIFVSLPVFGAFYHLNSSSADYSSDGENPAYFSEKSPGNQDKDAESETSEAENEKNSAPRENGNLSAPMDNAQKRITKKTFGMFVSPETSPVKDDKFRGFHTGADFEVFEKEIEAEVPIKAVCSGILALKKIASGYGGVAVQKCEIDGKAATIIYGHMDPGSIGFEKGDEIKAGEIVGNLGDNKSAETDGARKHLHLGIHKGENINIKGYVDSEEKTADWIDPCLLGICG